MRPASYGLPSSLLATAARRLAVRRLISDTGAALQSQRGRVFIIVVLGVVDHVHGKSLNGSEHVHGRVFLTPMVRAEC